MFVDSNLEKSVEKAQLQAALQQAVEAAREHYSGRPPPAVMTAITFLESVLKERDCAPDPDAADEARRERQVAVVMAAEALHEELKASFEAGIAQADNPEGYARQIIHSAIYNHIRDFRAGPVVVNLMGEDYELNVAAMAREQGIAVAVNQVMKELEHIFSEEPEEELSFQRQPDADAPLWRM